MSDNNWRDGFTDWYADKPSGLVRIQDGKTPLHEDLHPVWWMKPIIQLFGKRIKTEGPPLYHFRGKYYTVHSWGW